MAKKEKRRTAQADCVAQFARACSLAAALLLCPVATGRSAPDDKAARQRDFAKLSAQALRAQHDGQEEQAVRLYLAALQINPRWADGWQSVGMLLADRKEYNRAQAAFENLLDVEPKRGAGWALLGLCESELGRADDAYRHIQRGRSLGVGNADLENVAAFQAALLMIQKGEFDIAHHHLVEVARAGVDDQDLVAAFGLAALRIPSKPEALDGAQRSLALRVGQAELEAAHNKVDEVIAAYEALLRDQPRQSKLHYAFGNFLISAEHYDEGLEQMQKVLELDSNDVMAALQVAMTETRLNHPNQGLPYAERAVKLAPDLFAAHYALGWGLFKLGETERAIPELEQAVKLAPDSPQAHYSLSMAYMKARRRDDAYREREKFAHLKQLQAAPAGSPAGGNGAAPPGEPDPVLPRP